MFFIQEYFPCREHSEEVSGLATSLDVVVSRPLLIRKYVLGRACLFGSEGRCLAGTSSGETSPPPDQGETTPGQGFPFLRWFSHQLKGGYSMPVEPHQIARQLGYGPILPWASLCSEPFA